MKAPVCLMALLTLFLNTAAADLQKDDPVTLVETINGEIYAKVSENLEAYKSDNEALRTMVREDLMPLVDIKYAARLILGRTVRGIEKEKIDRFAELLSNMLVNRYATGLLDFSSEVKLNVLPQRGPLNEKNTKVRTRVTLPNGTIAPVDYAFRKTPEGWKAFDVIIEGISYITTYRNQIMPDVEANGIDSVIARLGSGELELTE